MQAIILAAGLGSRIRDFHDLPKGFITLGSEPIILESVQRLQKHGISDILIVTGYRSEIYEDWVQTLPNLSTVKNPYYDRTGSLYSLYCARNWVNDDTFILESDIIYESRAISSIFSSPGSAIMVSGETTSGDEVYVAGENNYLVNMSKNISDLDSKKMIGEFVGVNKLIKEDYFKLIDLIDKNESVLMKGHYEEQGFVELAKCRPIHCLKIQDLLWCEIDDKNHLDRAKKLYSKIL